MVGRTNTRYWPDQFLDDEGTVASGNSAFPDGELIGYVGVTPPMIGSYSSMTTGQRDACISAMLPLGSNVTVTANNSGELWLGMNDDAYSANYFDNAGSVVATVTVTKPGTVPELSSFLALLCGFTGLCGAAWRRRK